MGVTGLSEPIVRLGIILYLFSTCCIAVEGSTKPSIVLFGDSLSDNGNGYAAFVKFILSTNQANFRYALQCAQHTVCTITSKSFRSIVPIAAFPIVPQQPDVFLMCLQTYPEEPYYMGRWSNGPTWIEVAASQLGADLTDYGAGGATSGSVPARERKPHCTHRPDPRVFTYWMQHYWIC